MDKGDGMPGPAFAHALQTLQELLAHLGVKRALTAVEHQDRSLCGLASSRQDRPEQPGGQTLRLPTRCRCRSGNSSGQRTAPGVFLPPSEPRQFMPGRSDSLPLLSACPACTGTLSETTRRPEARSVRTNVRDPAGQLRPRKRPADHCRAMCDHTVSVTRGDTSAPPPRRECP